MSCPASQAHRRVSSLNAEGEKLFGENQQDAGELFYSNKSHSVPGHILTNGCNIYSCNKQTLCYFQQGDLSEFESCFAFACPKFLSPIPPSLEGPDAQSKPKDMQSSDAMHKEPLR